MRTLFRLVVVLLVVLGVFWVIQHRDLGEAGRDVRAGADKVVSGADKVVSKTEKVFSDVDVDKIVHELKATGRVVRRKTATAVRKVAEATQDVRTTAAIKAKIALDPKLSVLDISVDTTDGTVTLAGRVDQPEDVARAIRLAMESDDVLEVVSTLQVRSAHRTRASS